MNEGALLEAGALIPAATKVGAQEPVDEVSARVYRHQALGGKPVVLLCPDNLAQGDDLAMEFLGFEPPQVHGPVAKRRRQALGFPGWALINDPPHARYALELVKDMKREARRAKSKPGHAYDGFTAISKRLGRSVAHFLPSFWEEVGRVFMSLGNATYGSRAFTKAREAERVHALEVDENTRRDAFLEFALGGALSIKTLTEYGKELQRTRNPDEAWQFFRELCLRRTLGGMPPWSSMPKEMDQLLKGAKVDEEAERQTFLREVIDSPALARSPNGFWKGFSKSIKQLAAQDDHVAGTLLNLTPEGSVDNWEWLELLKKWDVLANAWREDVPDEAAPRGGPAAWYSRVISRAWQAPQAAFDLLEQMAGRIRAVGEPLQLEIKRWGTHQFDADLVDYALELKLAVGDPSDEAQFDLTEWADSPEGARDRPRDPLHVMADPRFAPLLTRAVPAAAGDTTFESAAASKQALAEARRQWLLGRVTQVGDGGLPDCDESLGVLESKTERAIFREFPEAHEALAPVDVAPVLARTLQGGILDEYGWPVLEEAVTRLKPSKKNKIQFFGQMPYVIVTDGAKALVVGRDEVVLEHELQLPKKHELVGLMFWDGCLTVHSRSPDYDCAFYWSDDPKKLHEDTYRYGSDGIEGAAVPIEGGGSFNGERIVRAGNKTGVGSGCRFFYDGQHFWRVAWESYERQIVQYDPAKAKQGRKSLPSFFEDFLQEGDELRVDECNLLALGPVVDQSPLGSANGLIGWRCKRTRQGVIECEGIDGRKFSRQPRIGEPHWAPDWLLSQVAGEGQCPVTTEDSWSVSRPTIGAPGGEHRLAVFDAGETGGYDAGQVTPLPVLFWHLLQPRDEATSRRLRQTTDEIARVLLEAAAADLQTKPPKGEPQAFPVTEKTVDKLFPQGHSRLRTGLISVIAHAARQQHRLASLLQARDPQGQDKAAADPQLEQYVKEGIDCLGVDRNYMSEGPLLPHLDAVARLFSGQLGDDPIPTTDYEWPGLLDRLEAKSWAALWTDEKKRPAWTRLLEALAEAPLLQLPGGFRIIECSVKEEDNPFKEEDYDDDDEPFEYLEQGGHGYLCFESWGETCKLLEYAPQGKFQTPPKMTIDSESVLKQQWPVENIRRFVELVREKGPPLISREKIQELADKMNVSLGVAGLIWFGYPNLDDWNKNYLPKWIREHLGLKVAQAEEAREAVKSLSDEVRLELLATLLRDDPAAPWDDADGLFGRLAEAWQRLTPKRIPLSGAMTKTINDMLGWGMEIGAFLDAISAPESHPLFTTDPEWKFDDNLYSSSLETSSEEAAFNGIFLEHVLDCLVHLPYALPAGDPARAAMPPLLAATLQRLQQPNLLLDLAGLSFFDEKQPDIPELMKSLLGEAIKRTEPEGWDADTGLVVARGTEHSLTLAFRPSRVTSPREEKQLIDLAAAASAKGSSDDSDGGDALRAMLRLKSPEFAALMQRIDNTPVPKGGWEQNPLLSVPELVQQVAGERGLGEPAAMLYLQLLALPDPTTAHVKQWNDWTTSAYNKAVKELAVAELVLEAKRSRAGRKHFLPGGWEALKTPHLPLETWKLPLLDITRDKEGKLQLPFARIVPPRPVHEQFAAAWKRVAEGDVPEYEEVS